VRPAAATLLAILVPLLAASCAEKDPLVTRLAQRTHYQVGIVSFIPRDNGTLLVEMEVSTIMPTRLPVLTVTVRQHGPDETVLRQDRVPLDLHEMDATGVLRVFQKVAAAGSEVASLSVTVETDPPAEEYGEFPELAEVAGT